MFANGELNDSTLGNISFFNELGSPGMANMHSITQNTPTETTKNFRNICPLYLTTDNDSFYRASA